MNPTQERRQEDRRNLLAADASGAHMQRKAAEERAAKAEADRDELLAALVEMVERFEPNAWGSNVNKEDALVAARAAIAKVTGSAA